MKSRLMAGPWITDFEREIVADALKEENWYEGRYDYVEKFEKEFAKFHERKYALMTPNCTQAIHLLLLALGIKENDEVIVPECTWTGTSAPITYCKAIPVFCDIEEKNWCLDPKSVEKKITEKTKAIIAVDLYGNMPDMDKLTEISKKYNIPLIEDAAEALGSKYKGIRAGKFGVGSVFSFHCTKTITTGEGGMLLLDDDKIFERAKFLRDHGRSNENPYDITEASPKYMPDNFRASLGYAQFLRLAAIIDKKRWILHSYQSKLSDFDDLQFNEESNDVHNGVWAPSLIFGKKYGLTKEKIMEELEKLNLPSRPFFYPLSSLSAYSNYKTGSKEENPVSYDLSTRGITLPSALILTEKDIEEYCNAIKKIIQESKKDS